MDNEKCPLRPDAFLKEGENGAVGENSMASAWNPQGTPAGEDPWPPVWEADDFAEAAEEEDPAGGGEALSSEAGAAARQVNGFKTEVAANATPLIEKEAETAGATSRLQQKTEESLAEEAHPEEPGASRPTDPSLPDIPNEMFAKVGNTPSNAVEVNEEETAKVPPKPQTTVPCEGSSSSQPPLPSNSEPQKTDFNPDQTSPVGGDIGGQRIDSTGYQHYQQSFQQEPRRFPPQGQTYPPYPQANANRQQGAPSTRPPWAGYAPPPPYQPMYGAPQARQWPNRRAGMPPDAMPKKKMEKGTRIFLWIACGLAACFAVGFGVYGAFLASNGVNFPIDPGTSLSQPDRNYPSQRPDNGGRSALTPGGSGPIDPDWGGADIQDQPTGDDPMGGNAVYEKAKQSVVGIRLYEPDAELEDSYIVEGSGVIMTTDGYIITNSHVLGDSNAYGVQVVLYTGEEYIAKVVGFDKKTDLAVIKIDVSGLTAAELGDSDDLRVGDRVYALGNPGGLNYFNSLTGGWVSALDRAVDSTAQTAMRYIQTDAAINPGNSGGALLNRFGQVIGINTAKIQGYEGMGFAIPMTTAKGVIDDLMRYGYVSGRVRLGITGQQLSTYVAQRNGVPQGVLIRTISDDSPLRNQGVRVDDIITHINGIEITAFEVLTDELARFQPGDSVTLTIYREGNSFQVDVVLLEDRGETQQALG